VRGKPGSQRRSRENERRQSKQPLSAKSVAHSPRRNCAEQTANQRTTHRPTFNRGRIEVKVALVEWFCPADNHPVVTKQQSAQRACRRSHPDVHPAE